MYTKGKKAQDLRSLAQQNAAKLEENRNKAKEIEDLKTEENGTYGAEGDQPEGPAGGGPVRLRNLKRKRQRERDSLGKGAKLITIPVVEVQGGEGEAGKQVELANFSNTVYSCSFLLSLITWHIMLISRSPRRMIP